MVVEIGPRFPLHSGASSRAILASLPPAFADEAVRELQPAAPRLRRGRLPRGARRDAACVATRSPTTSAAPAAPRSPRRSSTACGNVLGSISASGPVFRYPGDHQQAEHAALVVAVGRADHRGAPGRRVTVRDAVVPRSFLYVPGDRRDLVDKATGSGADA